MRLYGSTVLHQMHLHSSMHSQYGCIFGTNSTALYARQVVETIASAFERAADLTADSSQIPAGDSVEGSNAALPCQPLQRNAAGPSVAAQLENFAVSGCSLSPETEVIAEQVHFVLSYGVDCYYGMHCHCETYCQAQSIESHIMVSLALPSRVNMCMAPLIACNCPLAPSPVSASALLRRCLRSTVHHTSIMAKSLCQFQRLDIWMTCRSTMASGNH